MDDMLSLTFAALADPTRRTMLDRLGRHDEAFAEFTAMNGHWQTDPTQPRERARATVPP